MSTRTTFVTKKFKSNKNASVKDGNSRIKYIANFLSSEDAEELFDHLIAENEEIRWTEGEYMMFGKPIKTPRLLWAMRDDDGEVNEGYTVTESSVWTDVVRKLKEKIEETFGTTLTYAQMNYYRDGDDYIGWHTDKEVQKGDSIYSISLGVERRFVMREKNYKRVENPKKYEFNLASGSIIVLNRDASTVAFKHCVPKQKKVKEARINITFRNK